MRNFAILYIGFEQKIKKKLTWNLQNFKAPKCLHNGFDCNLQQWNKKSNRSIQSMNEKNHKSIKFKEKKQLSNNR